MQLEDRFEIDAPREVVWGITERTAATTLQRPAVERP